MKIHEHIISSAFKKKLSSQGCRINGKIDINNDEYAYNLNDVALEYFNLLIEVCCLIPETRSAPNLSGSESNS